MNNYTFPPIALVHNRRHDATPNHEVAVELRVTYRKYQKYISTGIKLLTKHWRNGTVTNRPDAAILNATLAQLVNDVREILLEMYKEGFFDLHAIPDRLQKKRKKAISFMEYCEQRAQFHKHGLRPVSADRYDRFLRFFCNWGGIVSFDDITDENIVAMDKVLTKRGLMSSSKWNNFHRFLKTFILDAQAEGLILRNPYKFLTIEKGNDEAGLEKCLQPEEFERLRNAEMPNARLERVRDLFIFHAYFGQSYEDLRAFRAKQIKTIEGKKVYTDTRVKTHVAYTVPLLPPALEILKKYHNKLPMLTNQKYNNSLKEVAAAAGLPYNLTTHWARHTCGTLLLNAGVPMVVVSKVLGHKSIKTTERIYAKWMSRTIVNEVSKVAVKADAKERFDKLVNCAVAAAKGTDSDHTALKAAFDSYYEWYENEVQQDNLPSFGYAPGSPQNRTVLAGQIVRSIKFGDYGLDEQQLSDIREIFDKLANKKTNEL